MVQYPRPMLRLSAWVTTLGVCANSRVHSKSARPTLEQLSDRACHSLHLFRAETPELILFGDEEVLA